MRALTLPAPFRHPCELKGTAIRSLLVLVALAAVGYLSLVITATLLARRHAPSSLASAVKLVPFNADYLISLAELKPRESEPLLHEAIRQNPFLSDVWIRLALQSEMQSRDIPTAERYYLEAARVNHMYTPKWALANFYFRQRDKNKFVAAATSALEITPYESGPLFSEAYALNADDSQVMRLIPQRPEVAFDYLQFVLASNRVDPIEPAAMKAAAFRPPRTIDEAGRLANWTALLGATEDRLISLNRFEAAARVLSQMNQTGWTQMAAPSVSAPLANSSFRNPITGHGFDWFLNPTPGVIADQMPESQKLRFTLSGTQPEQCRLLQQIVVLQPGYEYRFKWQAESSDFQNAIGLTWRLSPLGQDPGTEMAGPELFSREGDDSWTFTVPDNSRAFLLTLELKRPLGQVRAEGTFTLNNLSLSPAVQSSIGLGGLTGIPILQ